VETPQGKDALTDMGVSQRSEEHSERMPLRVSWGFGSLNRLRFNKHF